MLRIILTFYISLFVGTLKAQTPPQWFDSQWSDAIAQCQRNKKIFSEHLSGTPIPVAESVSVVFPEMLRYVLWKDLFETAALELLYVRYGTSKVDFSIGWFQMKPSFAEKLEREIYESTDLVMHYSDLVKYSVPHNDSVAIRSERIKRLKQLSWQLRYLNAFIALALTRYPVENLEPAERVKILAAAYNRGLVQSVEELNSFNKLKTFPYGPQRSNPFGYAQVAEYFYRTNAKKIFTNPKTL